MGYPVRITVASLPISCRQADLLEPIMVNIRIKIKKQAAISQNLFPEVAR